MPEFSTLDLLDRPLIFSQLKPLRPKELVKAAEKRGVRVAERQLEQLHRRRVLVPFFHVRSRQLRTLVRERERPGYAPWSSDVRELYFASAEGRLVDARTERFRPWLTSERRGFYLYSQYQLLALHALESVLDEVIDRYDRDAKTVVSDLSPIDRWTLQRSDGWRRLAIALEALDARYRPEIVGMLSGGEDVWNARRDLEDPRADLAFLSIDPSEPAELARGLLSTAHGFDPLDGWIELVRGANHRALERLSGDARMALDYRIGAEVLLRFQEDLAELGVAPPVETPPGNFWYPELGRLKSKPGELSEALADFGLSPHASLVVAVEGQTEMRIIPRVLEALGIPERSALVEYVDLQGDGNDAGVLARLILPPRLGDDRGEYSTLRRPLAHLAIVVDPDSKYVNDGSIAKLADGVVGSLPRSLRTEPIRRLIGDLISVHTWDVHLPFEFANFGDEDLASAIEHVSKVPVTCSHEDLVAAVLAQRHAPHPNIEGAFVRVARGVTKPDLAEALWPILKPAILDGGQSDSESSHPLVRIGIELRRIALETRRANAVEV